MLIQSYNPQDRYRRRAADRLAGVLTVLVLVVVSGVLGFWVGGKTAGYQEGVLKKQLAEMTQTQETMQETITELRAEAQTATARYDQIQKIYSETVPEGPMRELVSLLKLQLDEGRDPERLAFLIRSASPPRNCNEPETRRFVLSTPAYKGAESKVVLAEGALVIKGSGFSAMNAGGQPEAWYDPSKPVSIEFVALGGMSEVKSGVMPIHYSVVVAGREYRIAVTEGARSFAKVTYDSCDYP